jgi:hypothetical protein
MAPQAGARHRAAARRSVLLGARVAGAARRLPADPEQRRPGTEADLGDVISEILPALSGGDIPQAQSPGL